MAFVLSERKRHFATKKAPGDAGAFEYAGERPQYFATTGPSQWNL